MRITTTVMLGLDFPIKLLASVAEVID